MTEFPPFRLDIENQCLWRGAERITLTPKAFLMLEYLVGRAGRLVNHTELLQALWPDSFVQPDVLKSHILRDCASKIRGRKLFRGVTVFTTA